MDFRAMAEAVQPEVVAFRRDLHEHPEASFQEFRTTEQIAKEMDKLGIPYRRFEPTGLIAEIKGGKPGKTIALRADIDALSITEKTGLPFASKNDGFMHACGHDTHTAMLLGAAKLLMDNKDKVKGRVKFMFQPGEEGYKGALHMVEAGLLENPHVDAALGMHSQSASDYPTGTIMHTTGPSAASADGFKVIVHGKGAHGARPEDGIDPVNILAHILIALQTINSRERNQKEPLILTIGQIIAGDACNIIPERGYFTGTIRTFNQQVREHAKRRFIEIVNGMCATFGGHADIEWTTEMAPTINDPAVTPELLGYIRELVGEENMAEVPASMGSEDFSEVLLNVPGSYLNLSFGSKEEGYLFGGHHPKIRHNEDALPIGSAIYAQVAIEWLQHNN